MSSLNETEKLLKLVNSSGFPFPVMCREHIRSMSPNRGWHVINEEYPWNDLDSGTEGFIDLVVGCRTNYDVLRMVIECKRTRDGDWVFLLPDTSQPPKELLVCCIVGVNVKPSVSSDY